MTDGTPADEILAVLVLPALSTFELASTHTDDSAALTGLFTRSSCPVQVLKLEGYFNLGPILASAPLLKYVDAAEAYLRLASMDILPAELLKLKCCITSEDASTFLEMLEKRLQTEVGRRGWRTSVELVVENADDELIRMLDLKLADLEKRYGWPDFVTFCKVDARLR